VVIYWWMGNPGPGWYWVRTKPISQ